jgi:hypothetical protein
VNYSGRASLGDLRGIVAPILRKDDDLLVNK